MWGYTIYDRLLYAYNMLTDICDDNDIFCVQLVLYVRIFFDLMSANNRYHCFEEVSK